MKPSFLLNYHEAKMVDTYCKGVDVENVVAGIRRVAIDVPHANLLLAHICSCIFDALHVVRGVALPRTPVYTIAGKELAFDVVRWLADEPVDDTPMFSTLTGGLEALGSMTGLHIRPDTIRALVASPDVDAAMFDVKRIFSPAKVMRKLQAKESFTKADQARIRAKVRAERAEYINGFV